MLKLLVIGLGYVGTANAVLLSQHNEVTCFDLDTSKSINLINGISPIEDKELSEYLSSKTLNLKLAESFPFEIDNFDFVIIATPTNYDPDTNYFDTSLSSIGDIPFIKLFDFETSKSKQVTSLCCDKRTAFAVPT